jgi:glycosyltransferase involved in cell wall biosynthesis
VKRDYVLVTPVYNEASLLPDLVASVGSQTVLPKRWVIVDDGSTDATPDILEQCAKEHGFIVIMRLERLNVETYYGRKVFVVMEGIKALQEDSYDFLGVLDADITMAPSYYVDMLAEFDRDPQLGLASGVYLDNIDGQLHEVLIDPAHVPAALTLFRRECYEDVGGYIDQKYGGEDTYVEIMARLHGWKTRSFSQYRVVHHRPVGTGQGASILRARFRQGLTEYDVATHPYF